MRNFQHKNKWRAFLESKIALGFLTIVLLFFAYSVLGFVGKMIETMKNKKIASDKIVELQQDKIKLSSDIDNLGTPKGQEESIREKFGLAKEGESMIVIVEDKTNKNAAKGQNGASSFSFLKNWFK